MYYKHVCVPDMPVGFDGILFQDFMDFVSPQTEKTRDKLIDNTATSVDRVR
jgi:hypothetical protein